MSFTTSLESLTLSGARAIMAAAQEEARRNGWAATIAIVDVAGAVLLLERDERAWAASVDVAIGKASSAIRFGRPTRALEEMINGGRTAFIGAGGVTPMIGGVPILAEGKVVGAIGVSGLTPDRDEVVAKAGVAALA